MCVSIKITDLATVHDGVLDGLLTGASSCPVRILEAWAFMFNVRCMQYCVSLAILCFISFVLWKCSIALWMHEVTMCVQQATYLPLVGLN
jgi:hypothetical protein